LGNNMTIPLTDTFMGTRGHLTHLLYRHDQTAPHDSNQGRLWKHYDNTID
jgi:hypothetical protein